jgi:hypothetical protein
VSVAEMDLDPGYSQDGEQKLETEIKLEKDMMEDTCVIKVEPLGGNED